MMAHMCPFCDTTQDLTDWLPVLLEELDGIAPVPMNTLGQRRALRRRLPERGVYAFLDAGTPVYVRRSNRIPKPVLEHGRPGANPGNAPVATRIATHEFLGGRDQNLPAAAEVVRQMMVKAIAIDCPNLQAVFEVYAHIALGHTRYNDFAVH